MMRSRTTGALGILEQLSTTAATSTRPTTVTNVVSVAKSSTNGNKRPTIIIYPTGEYVCHRLIGLPNTNKYIHQKSILNN